MAVKVRERQKGSGVWWIFIDHQGVRKAKKIGDERTAREVAEKIKATLVLGEFDIAGEKNDCPTFKDFAEQWLSLPHDWKESTRDSYRNNLRIHAYPKFGKHRLDMIGRKELKAFFDSLILKGAAPSMVSLIRSSISGVLAYALESELINSNPARDITLRYKRKILDINPLDEDEGNKLLEQAKTFLGGRYYPSILCALRTGARLGELQALQWGDLDFNGRFIEIRRSYRRNRITETKNRKRRRVDMTPLLAQTLKNLQTSQKKKALKTGRPVPLWVFANESGEMFQKTAFRHALWKCLEAAGLRRIRAHDLRHSYATIRLLRGHNVGDVSYQLGHSSIKITYDVYAHWIPGKFKSEVDELDQPQPAATHTQPSTESSDIIQPFQ